MDYNYLFNLICQRRLVTLSKVESELFNFVISFGLASGTQILPAAANTFYYIADLNIMPDNITGAFQLRFAPNSGAGSAGATIAMRINNSAVGPYWMSGIECDSMEYNVQTHSSGNIGFIGTCYTITYV